MKKLIILASLLTICIFSVFSQIKENHLAELLKNHQYQKALEYIETQEPTKEFLFEKALCNKALGEYQKAILILELLDKEYEGDVQILSELAICYQATANRKGSIECYDELIRIDSANIYFKIQKAELQFQQGKYEDALTLFYNIYNQNKSPNTLKKIAQSYEMMNEVDSAMAYYRKTLSENPLDAFSAASLTNICLKEGLLPEGKDCSQAFMDIDTTNLQVNLLNALCYYASEEEYDEAINRFTKCELRGDTGLILNRSLGTSYYMIKNYYYSELYLDKAFRQDTTNNTVLFALATSSMELGDHWKSTPLFSKLRDRIKPDSTLQYLCHKNLALSYQKGWQYKEAAETYIKSLDYARADLKMNIYYTIANIYDDQLNDPQNALSYYLSYRETLANYLEILNNRPGRNEERIKDSENRIKALDEHILELKKGEKEGRKSFKSKQGIQIISSEKNTGKISISEKDGKTIITKEEEKDVK
ncbi:MAG: tetratricopeptide repeat protein [Dysgonomonas sp.]